ncbi:hypothetical protein Cassandra_0371 [Pseudomonas phage Cassandra]|nr:hypothetical protein Cassandra_0371 [Pseudomonas phage Cassandra]
MLHCVYYFLKTFMLASALLVCMSVVCRISLVLYNCIFLLRQAR